MINAHERPLQYLLITRRIARPFLLRAECSIPIFVSLNSFAKDQAIHTNWKYTMQKTIVALYFFAMATVNVHGQEQAIDYVNNMIGTTGAHASEYGGLIPEVSTPFGMTKWTPATRLNMISKRPYHYDDKKLIGFMGTHQPVIWMGDYGFLSIMPQSDELKISPEDRAVSFSHDDEYSTPY